MSEIDLSTFTFATERLQLRPLDPADEALYHELYTDPDTMRFIAAPLTVEQAANSFRKVLARQCGSSLKGRCLVMLEQATLQPVGICGTSQYDTEGRRLEVGILLTPEARRRGFAREALTALLERIFAMSSVQEIYVRFSARCPAVERLNIRVGFTPCAGDVQEEGPLSKRVWSVRRSSWYVKQVSG